MGYVTNFDENKILFTLCDCRSEVLVIEYDPEIQMAELAILETDSSYRQKMSLWQRLRYSWRVLLNKRPYNDQIIINKKQIQEIKKFLSELL